MTPFLTPSRTVGLCLARRHVGVVSLRRSMKRWNLESFVERQLSIDLFASSGMDELRAVLNELAADFATRHTPVHVSLPDPAVRAAVFELEELPRSRSAQNGLVDFRFSREPATEVALASVSQSLGSAGGPMQTRAGNAHLLFGMSIDSNWLRSLQETLRGGGIVAWSIVPAALQTFNVLHDRLTGQSGALLSVNHDSWALMLWDESGRLRHCSAHWRDSHVGPADDHRTIASEAVRVIVAYADAQPERSIRKIFVTGASEIESIASLLDARASEPCVRLSLDEFVVGCDRSFHASRTGTGALSAALSS